MSFEKAVKNTGTRRKARECALQMLYAADVTGVAAAVLVRHYWSEYGYNELFKDANLLIGGFTEDVSLVLSNVSELSRAVGGKRIAGYVKEVKDKNKEIGLSYKRFVERLIAGNYPTTAELGELLKDYHIAARRAVTEISTEAKYGVTTSENADPATSPIAENIEKTMDKLFKTTLPGLDSLIENTSVSRKFTDKLTLGTLNEIKDIDAKIRKRAEHWRIERMAIVDRNVLRLAVYEFLHEETPHTVVINEALEIARRFSTFEATQFINGILDAIKHDLEKTPAASDGKSQASTN